MFLILVILILCFVIFSKDRFQCGKKNLIWEFLLGMVVLIVALNFIGRFFHIPMLNYGFNMFGCF